MTSDESLTLNHCFICQFISENEEKLLEIEVEPGKHAGQEYPIVAEGE